MAINYYLAVDIGASSGRHILGWVENGEVMTREVYRFPNGVEEAEGHLIWDADRLLREVKEGIRRAKQEADSICSLSIDTWGVDYVLLQGEEAVKPCYAYRDDRTEAYIPEVHSKMPFAELYSHTGCQYQPFNSVYQLYTDLRTGRLEGVTDFLMLPEYLMYRLCGNKVREYTNATTTGMINAETGAYDLEIVKRLGLPEQLFGKLTMPGERIGEYEGIPVVLCATHDTGSAVEGIPMEGNEPYISSGTWSLLGVKTEKPITAPESEAANYSNEGGVGYNRYQKNIMGMWIINELKRELCPDTGFGEIVSMAEKSSYDGIVDVNRQEFLAPESMRAAFDTVLSQTQTQTQKPEEPADYFRCAYRSLAAGYAGALKELENNTGKTYQAIYIVGGGAKNGFLNQLTEDATGKKVIALPIEATALGNLRVQMRSNREELK